MPRVEVFGAALAAGTVPARRQADGTVVVEDVPIFAEIRETDPGVLMGERTARDREWLARAIERHRARVQMGQASPLVLRHYHQDPRRVGEYRLTRLDRVQVNPEEPERWTIFGDLVFEDESAFADSKGYDGRSAEISPDQPEEIAAVALLRDSVPFHRFPVLRPQLAETFSASVGFAGQVWRHSMHTHEQARAEIYAQAVAFNDVSSDELGKNLRLSGIAAGYADADERPGVRRDVFARYGQHALKALDDAWERFVLDPTGTGLSWLELVALALPVVTKSESPAIGGDQGITFAPSIDRGIGERDVRLVRDWSRVPFKAPDNEKNLQTPTKLDNARTHLERLKAVGGAQNLHESRGALGLGLETFAAAPLHGKEAIQARIRAAERDLAVHEAQLHHAETFAAREEAPRLQGAMQRAMETFGTSPDKRARVVELFQAWEGMDAQSRRGYGDSLIDLCEADHVLNPASTSATYWRKKHSAKRAG
jgi:hypothetical protein